MELCDVFKVMEKAGVFPYLLQTNTGLTLKEVHAAEQDGRHSNPPSPFPSASLVS